MGKGGIKIETSSVTYQWNLIYWLEDLDVQKVSSLTGNRK